MEKCIQSKYETPPKIKMKRIIIISGCFLTLFSCTNYRVYQYTFDDYNTYLICKKKGEIEHYRSDFLNFSYMWNLNSGVKEEELKKLGSEKINHGFAVQYKIDKSILNFMYQTTIRNDEKITNVIPLNGKSDSCFIIKAPFFELYGIGGNGYANDFKEPWPYFNGRKVSDTIYFFHSHDPVNAMVLQLTPCFITKVDSCNYEGEIKIIIDKEYGIPLSYSYPAFYFNGQDYVFYNKIISCNDYKMIRITKRRLKKVLW